jgi:prepilin-type processing-associated H-X9-DG protein
VPDGTSNTIMFVESAGGLDAIGGDQFFSAPHWTQQAWAGALWWSGYGMCPGTSSQFCSTNPAGQGLFFLGAGSLHSGGICNVALADGSVRSLNAPAIDSLSLIYLAGVRDGEIQTTDF